MKVEDIYPNHTWNLDTQPGGYTVTGGKGGVSFSWQELLRGAQELESLSSEFKKLSKEMEEYGNRLNRLQDIYPVIRFEYMGTLPIIEVSRSVFYQGSEFGSMAEKVKRAYAGYAADETRALRSFERSYRPGVDAEGVKTMLPQVSEGDAFWHLGDELTAGAHYFAMKKYNAFKIGPISTTLLQSGDGDRSISNHDPSLSGLIQRTGELNAVDGEPVEGVVEVSKIEVEGSQPRYIVTIPGTQHWGGYDTDNPIDMAGNLAGLWGAPFMADAVSNSLRAAGAASGSDVMLVGHSGGGILARAVAADPAFLADFDSKYVLTAGSPVANTPLPDQTVGLNLQQKTDPVTGTDFRAAPDTPNNITVEFQTDALEEPADNEVDEHSVYNYSHKAADLESSEHASVAPVVAGVAAFAPKGASVSSYKFKLERTGQGGAMQKGRNSRKEDVEYGPWAKGR